MADTKPSQGSKTPDTPPAAGQSTGSTVTQEAAPQYPNDPAKVAASGSPLERARLKAPHLTAEFVAEHQLSEEYLEAVATGLEPPPPYNGPVKATELHYTPGGWQVTPLGVQPEDLPETGRVHADTASPGETRTQGDTQAMGSGLSPDQTK